MTIIYKDTEYALATTLRVAYKIQGQHNHESYLDVFNKLGEMPIEQQIGIIYASFAVANPSEATFITQQSFLDYCLDNYDLSYVMETIQGIIEGIVGKKITEEAKAEVESEAGVSENFQK